MRAWILAGGRSSRFGSDKASYLIDGVPLARRLADELARAGLTPGLVVKTPKNLGLPERVEPEAEFHPLFGVAAALDDGPALIVPCDVIGLGVDQLGTLLSAWATHPQGVVATSQPLLMILPADCARRARDAAAAGVSVRAFVAPFFVVDLGPLGNLNLAPMLGG